MSGFSYQLELLEPVLANQLAGDTNTARSFNFIPGGVIRGAVIAAYNTGHLDASDKKVQRLFFDGSTRFLHAYPFVEKENLRASPVPLSWRRLKDDEVNDDRTITIYDLSRGREKEGQKSVGEGMFCFKPGDNAYQLKNKYQINVHTQRDAEQGRAIREIGTVYRYEALPMGTKLMGVVLTKDEADAKEIETILQGATIYLGKARTAGYGQARIHSLEALFDDWREVGSDWNWDNSASAPTEFTLTFLSEAIIRDEYGQHSLDIIHALQTRLGVAGLETIDDAVFRKKAILGGFNRKWNLPLPQVAAIERGSVFVIQSDVPVPVAKLKGLEETGLGERRAEGYGRVAINWYKEPTLDYIEVEDDSPWAQAGSGELKDEHKDLAFQFLERLLRRDLDRLLIEAVNQTEITDRIPNSQLSRWRTEIRNSFSGPDKSQGIKDLETFRLKEEKKASAAWEKMRRARVRRAGEQQGGRVTEWIKEMLGEDSHKLLATWMSVGELPARSLNETLTVGVGNELADEYRLRLLEGVLKKKAREQAADAKRKGGENGRN
jgi:CRISPR-associated protein Csx10